MHNVNALTKEVCLDLTGDETSWGRQGWVEAQIGLVGRFINKPGVYKVG